MLKGNRTYITAGLIAAVQVARALGWISADEAETLTSLLLGGGLAFLRAGVGNKLDRRKFQSSPPRGAAQESSVAV